MCERMITMSSDTKHMARIIWTRESERERRKVIKKHLLHLYMFFDESCIVAMLYKRAKEGRVVGAGSQIATRSRWSGGSVYSELRERTRCDHQMIQS